MVNVHPVRCANTFWSYCEKSNTFSFPLIFKTSIMFSIWCIILPWGRVVQSGLVVHLNPAHPERKTQTRIFLSLHPSFYLYFTSSVSFCSVVISDLQQARGFLLSLEAQASQGAPGHPQAPFSLLDPLNQEHPKTDTEQGDLQDTR